MGPSTSIAVKICGITQVKQAISIAHMGADAIGVIGVKKSPRFVAEPQKRRIFQILENLSPETKRVWVVANPSIDEISESLKGSGTPSVIQLHGEETTKDCEKFKKMHQKIQWWKALRIREPEDLEVAKGYEKIVDALLLDAWDNSQLGGTGKRIPIEWLKDSNHKDSYWLAGGISSDWIPELLSELRPSGFDASSKLELSPGIKDLKKVEELIKAVKDYKIP